MESKAKIRHTQARKVKQFIERAMPKERQFKRLVTEWHFNGAEFVLEVADLEVRFTHAEIIGVRDHINALLEEEYDRLTK